MQFIVSGQRIAVENFVTGKLYTILWKNDTQVTLTCISIGADCVVFQGEAPLNLFTLTMQNADTIDTIEPTQLGTTNYNNLINKPSINGVDLIGNKTSSDLGIREVPAVIETDEGKVLTADDDGTYSWQELPEGTTNYNDLSNKPQINSVTLTGNVSLEDLGAAAAADIPTTPADVGAEPAITSENMLDADLVDDSNSTKKFATAAQLAQIATNETNISLIKHAANTSIYIQETKPTTPTTGDYWLSSANGVKTYVANDLSFDTSTDLKTAYLVELIDNRCEYRTTDSTSRTLVISCSANAQYIVSVNSKTLRCAIYNTIPTNNSVTTAYAVDNLSEYSEHSVTVQSPSGGAYIAVNCYLSNVEAADGKTFDEIFDTLTITEKKWS